MPLQRVRMVQIAMVFGMLPTLAGAQTGQIVGVVGAVGGTPVSDAKVTIVHAVTSASHRTATTAEGR